MLDHDGEGAVILKLSEDGSQPGSVVALIYLDDAWWSLVSTRPDNLVEVGVAAGALGLSSDAIGSYEGRAQLTLEVLDRVHSDVDASRQLAECTE
ncbi:MAG: hypothetical protein QOJ29_3367 [Thermoleophilaceae bacterium]|jgi:hypothetical protein|nr:hypothetical protein [Thermoleophilaceae bacterium]